MQADVQGCNLYLYLFVKHVLQLESQGGLIHAHQLRLELAMQPCSDNVQTWLTRQIPRICTRLPFI